MANPVCRPCPGATDAYLGREEIGVNLLSRFEHGVKGSQDVLNANGSDGYTGNPLGRALCPDGDWSHAHFWGEQDRQFCPWRVHHAGHVHHFWLWTLVRIDPLLSVLICFVVLFFFGMGAQYTTVRPTLGSSPLMHIFTTGGLAVAMRNLALFLWKGDFRSVTTSYSGESLNCWGVMVAVPKLIALILILLISVGLFIFFKTTYLGKAIRATTQDRMAARLMGINTDRISTIAFGIGSAFAGRRVPY